MAAHIWRPKLQYLVISPANEIKHANTENELKKYVIEQRLSSNKLLLQNQNIANKKDQMQILVENMQKTSNEVLMQQLKL